LDLMASTDEILRLLKQYFTHPLQNNVKNIPDQGFYQKMRVTVTRLLLQSKPVNSKASDVDLNEQSVSDSVEFFVTIGCSRFVSLLKYRQRTTFT
ncbi:hypothetical protein L9F63_015764, partial [Diploptera punctata]